MTNIINAPTLSESQKARAAVIAHKALVSFSEAFYAKNGRLPSEEESKIFADTLATSVTKSISKADPEIEASRRASASKAVAELAALDGVKFVHHRAVEGVLEKPRKPKKGEKPRRVRPKEAGDYDYFNYVESTRGGCTLAFKYFLDEHNNLFIQYATSFCRDDENFDPLIGKQESLKKFLAGEIIAVQINHEPFGPVKLDQLASKYKSYETAAKEAQPK